MKKKLIAASAASLALAAMPVVGVFATQTTPADTVKDTLSLSVLSGCTMTRNLTGDTPAANADQNYNFGDVAPGHTDELLASTDIDEITLTCNGGGWRIQAAGTTNLGAYPVATGVTADAASLISVNSVSEVNTITAAIPAGTTGGLDGSDSEWAFKITSSNMTVLSNYNDYSAVTTTATPIASIANASSPVSFTPSYKVSVAADQASGTYTGSITYSILAGAGE